MAVATQGHDTFIELAAALNHLERALELAAQEDLLAQVGPQIRQARRPLYAALTNVGSGD